MKKFLTVLLALSVVFTYTVGSAFATVPANGKYTSADYAEYLDNQWNNYYSQKLSVVEQDYVKTLAPSETIMLYGEVKAGDLGLKAYKGAPYWTDVAIKALQATIRSEIVTAKEEYISKAIETTFGTNTEVTISPEDSNLNIGLSKIYGVTLNAIVQDSAGYVTNAVNKNIEKFSAEQAKSLYAGVIAAINAVSESKYSDENANKIAEAKAKAVKAVEAVKNGTDADLVKAEAYVTAFKNFQDEIAAIPTIDDENLNGETSATTIAEAVAAYMEYALGNTYKVFKLEAGKAVPDDYASVKNLDEKVYKAGANKTATVFGVVIANTDKVTAAEAVAVNKAYREAVIASADVVDAYAKAIDAKNLQDRINAVKALYSNGSSTYECLRTINKAMNAADVYAKVVAEGKVMKETTKYGVKVYDDAKVDQAVKEAETLVYADLKKGFDKPVNYIFKAAEKGGYDLYATNFEYKAFRNAIAAAKAKFFKADGTPQIKVLYGENKTPEADYVYLKATYATVEAAEWTLIANSAVNALEIAESYADIDAALENAAKKMSALMLAKDETAVTAAIESHKAALEDSLAEAKKIMGTDNYAELSYTEAYRAGLALINAADTVEEVKTAYTQAEALIRNIPTKAELDAAAKEVITKIKGLPSTSALTVADKDAVVAVMNAYIAFDNMYGGNTNAITNTHILNADLDAVFRLVYKDLKAKLDDMIEAVTTCDPTTDKGAEKLVAMKDAIKDLIAEVDEFNALLVKIESVDSLNNFVAATALKLDTEVLEGTLNAENAIWNAELHNLLVLANTAKTVAEKKAVVDAYSKLTDRQKYKMEQNLKTLIEGIKSDLIETVKSIKVVKNHSVAGKGYIKISWSTVGDTSAIDGYRVYRSKKANSGYKYMFKTTKQSYKNTKNLKKGTRYFYKVRAYADIDGQRYFSDYSNKANRTAK